MLTTTKSNVYICSHWLTAESDRVRGQWVSDMKYIHILSSHNLLKVLYIFTYHCFGILQTNNDRKLEFLLNPVSLRCRGRHSSSVQAGKKIQTQSQGVPKQQQSTDSQLVSGNPWERSCTSWKSSHTGCSKAPRAANEIMPLSNKCRMMRRLFELFTSPRKDCNIDL